MESFYGGRQGNPFVIVKRFDGVDIPQIEGAYVYKTTYYAYDKINSTSSLDYFIFDSNYKPIEKTVDNQFDYTWKLIEKNGQIIRQANDIPFVVPIELAEGMVQCFQKGGASTSEVNYGEYVLIDTNTDVHRINDIENGRIYRRGMDYTNELGGAEYIGCIQGPQGLSPDINMSSFNHILNNVAGSRKDTYTVGNNDLVPGFDGTDFNDTIEYAWAELRDGRGDIKTCLFGFKFPYLVTSFTASPYSAYARDDEELITRLDDQSHPYFSSWHINVPRGIHGEDAADLEIITTKTKPGVQYYSDPALSTVVGVLPDTSYGLLLGSDYDKNSNYAAFYYGTDVCYVKMEDTWCTRLRYKAIDYEQSEQGVVTYVDLGAYNVIEEINADENGIVSVIYTHDDPVDNLGQLAYLLEVLISKRGNAYNVPENHLLILFSNRAGTVTYDSPRFGKPITGYVDLGYVKGDPGPGLSIIAGYDDVSQLPSDPMTIPNYKIGDAVVVGRSLYIYDYLHDEWIYIGSAGSSAPEEVVRVAPADTSEADKIQNNGIWFVIEPSIYAD